MCCSPPPCILFFEGKQGRANLKTRVANMCELRDKYNCTIRLWIFPFGGEWGGGAGQMYIFFPEHQYMHILMVT